MRRERREQRAGAKRSGGTKAAGKSRARRGRRAVEEEVWEEEYERTDADEDEAETGGWKASTAHLGGISRLARISAWVLVASGPVLGMLAFLGSSGPAQGAVKPTVAKAPASSVGPSGFAELFVSAYLQAGRGTEQDLAPYYSGSVPLSVEAGTRSATQSTVIASRQVQPGYWSVTVAVDVTSKNRDGKPVRLGVQYFRVGVQVLGPAGSGGSATSAAAVTGYIATSLPAQVAAPVALEAGELAYVSERGTSSASPSVEAARGFLVAYLTGATALDRYTSPGTRMQAVSPAPYMTVKVTGVRDSSSESDTQKVPADGTVLRQLVQVAATDQAGNEVPLSYALTLTSRAGRWEVASVDDAPMIGARGTPSEAPRPTGPEPDPSTVSPSPSLSSS